MRVNLLADLPTPGSTTPQETFEDILTRPGVRIERIVSTGQCSPDGYWYDQPHGEWVVVLAGSAGLAFDDDPEVRVMRAGDFVDIPPHRRHRVAWTDGDMPTVWLAVHYGVP
jgi:cupin 2 domain-containing protein